MFKDYTVNQIVLPLDLVQLPENDISFHIHHLVESIPNEAFHFFVFFWSVRRALMRRNSCFNALRHARIAPDLRVRLRCMREGIVLVVYFVLPATRRKRIRIIH